MVWQGWCSGGGLVGGGVAAVMVVLVVGGGGVGADQRRKCLFLRTWLGIFSRSTDRSVNKSLMLSWSSDGSSSKVLAIVGDLTCRFWWDAKQQRDSIVLESSGKNPQQHNASQNTTVRARERKRQTMQVFFRFLIENPKKQKLTRSGLIIGTIGKGKNPPLHSFGGKMLKLVGSGLRYGRPLAATRSFHSSRVRATTILAVKKGSDLVMIGDGQVSMGDTVLKPNAKKVRRIGANGSVRHPLCFRFHPSCFLPSVLLRCLFFDFVVCCSLACFHLLCTHIAGISWLRGCNGRCLYSVGAP